MMERFKVWSKDRHEWERSKSMIDNDGQLSCSSYHGWCKVNMDRYVICWSSGKFDKKGNEIYNNSILRWYPNKPKNHIDVVVGLCDTGFYFGDWYENDFPDTKVDSLVIGNVFDNPELIP